MPNHSPLILLLFPLPLNHTLSPLVKLHKPRILRILQPLPNMERQRQVIEHILSDERVVLSEVVEEGFFVAEVEVVDEVVVDRVGLGLGGNGLELFVEVLESEGKVTLFLLLVFVSVGFVKLFVGFVEDFEGELVLLIAFQLPEPHSPHFPALLRNFLLLLVFQSRLSIRSPLLLLKHLGYFKLRPHELTITRPLLHNTPPKPPLQQPLNHRPIVACSDIRLPLLGSIGDIIMLEIKV